MYKRINVLYTSILGNCHPVSRWVDIAYWVLENLGQD